MTLRLLPMLIGRAFQGAALGAIAFAGIAILVPGSPVRSGGSFDFTGATLLSSLLVLTLYAFTKTHAWGWGDPRVIGSFVVAVELAVVFYRVERRAASRLVDMEVSNQPTIRYTNLASIMVGFAMYSCNLVVTQLLQAPTSTGYGFGQTMVIAGLCAAPMGFLMMIISPFAARVIRSNGPRFAFISGIVVIMVGFLAGIFMLHEVWETIIVAMLVGAGIAMSYAAAPTLIMRSVPASQTAVANSVNTLSRSIGTSLASAVHGGILATAFVAGGTRYGPLDPFQLCFALAVVACVIAIAIAWRIPTAAVKTRPVRDVEAPAQVEVSADVETAGSAYRSKGHAGPQVSHRARRAVLPRPVVRRTVSRRPAARQPRK